MGDQYTFDKNFNPKKARTTFWSVFKRILFGFVASISLAIVYYVIFALFFSTDSEKILEQENAMYEREIPLLQERLALVDDVVEGLRIKDDIIYEEIFQSASPDVNPVQNIKFLSNVDTLRDEDIEKNTAKVIAALEQSSARTDANFMEIVKVLTREGYDLPPMTIPLDNFSFAQTGASVGNKVNPFYKVKMQHNGLDMIAGTGVAVYAAADGVVKEVIRSRKGLGNVVVLDHGDGYVTKYAHLADIAVSRGRSVKKGSRIGDLGISGNSFAPHLHYEVWRDTVALNPINHFFASVDPEQYVNMLIMSVNTGQSLD